MPKPVMAKESYLIAGGGIAGLAAALAVALSGDAATVIEQAPVFGETGAGLQLGPNAVRALKHLGAWDAVAPSTFAPERIVIRDGHDGTFLQQIAFGRRFESRFGEPYRVVHRADLLLGLLATARASSRIALQPGKRLVGFAESGETVVAELSAGERLIGDALIGADGARSFVRERLVAPEGRHRLGQLLFRALIPTANAPSDLDLGAVSLWLCRGAHLVHYPVGAGKSLNIVAAVDVGARKFDRSAPVEASEVAARFRHCHGSLAAVLALPATWTKWPGIWRQPLRCWGVGRATLIGDAAHPMPPFLAQGAAMALEDAAVLASVLAIEQDIAKAFRAYERLRLPRTSRVVRASHRQARVYHASGLLRPARNALLKRLGADAFLSRLAWLYDWQPPEH